MPADRPLGPFDVDTVVLNDDGTIGYTLPAGWTVVQYQWTPDPVRHPEGVEDQTEYA